MKITFKKNTNLNNIFTNVDKEEKKNSYCTNNCLSHKNGRIRKTKNNNRFKLD